MNLRSICITNGIGVSILLMLYYASRARIRRHRVEDRLYRFMIFGVMLGSILEAFSYYLDGKVFPGAIMLNQASNTYLFTVNLLLPLSVLVYVDLGLYGDISRIWKRYRPQLIVCAMMLCLTLVNVFVPICYRITERNVYERMTLSYVYYVVILYYCVSSVLVTKRYEKENGARAFFNIEMFLVPILIGLGLQSLFYGLSLAWLAAAIGLVGLYMMQQNELAYVDSLVDTYNRQYLDLILSTWIGRDRHFVGAMLDVDRFKKINDRYGHSEGDRALKTVAGILKRSRLDHEWIFRFAGDEFIVLKMTDSPDGLSAYLDEVERGLAEHNRGARQYPLRLSYGVSYFEKGDIDSFLKEMDGRMYEMKARHHEACKVG